MKHHNKKYNEQQQQVLALLRASGVDPGGAADHADPPADAEPGEDDDIVEAILAHKHVSGRQLCSSSGQVSRISDILL